MSAGLFDCFADPKECTFTPSFCSALVPASYEHKVDDYSGLAWPIFSQHLGLIGWCLPGLSFSQTHHRLNTNPSTIVGHEPINPVSLGACGAIWCCFPVGCMFQVPLSLLQNSSLASKLLPCLNTPSLLQTLSWPTHFISMYQAQTPIAINRDPPLLAPPANPRTIRNRRNPSRRLSPDLLLLLLRTHSERKGGQDERVFKERRCFSAS